MEQRKAKSYIIHNGQNVGPFSDAELKTFIAQRKLTLDGMVWRETYSKPVKLRLVPEFSEAPGFGHGSPAQNNPFGVPQQQSESMVAQDENRGQYRDHAHSQGSSASLVYTVIKVIGTICGILIALGMGGLLLSNLREQSEAAKVDQTSLAFGVIQQDLQMYRIHNNTFPPTLKALLVQPNGVKTWRGPYIEDTKLKDPWDHDFTYESDGRSFRLHSAGRDGKMGTADDIDFPPYGD